MADDTLAPISRAVEARRAFKQPSKPDLKVCEKNRWTLKDIHCWNGNTYSADCGFVGSQNIPIAAETGLGNWDFIVALCKLESVEGDFGVEHGSTSSFYYGLPFSCKVTAYLHLMKLGRRDDAKIVRRSILSHLAWDALSAIPASRMRDTLFLPEAKFQTTTKAKDTWLCVAVAGMRNTPVERGQFTSQNSHSIVLAKAIDDPGDKGLTNNEQELLRRTVQGDVAAAREVSTWMYGTIDSSTKQWQFHITRTARGVECNNAGLQWPNPMKPCISACVVTTDGHWQAMQTSRRVRGWAEGYSVRVDNGMMIAESQVGNKLVNVSMPTLTSMGGEVLWRVDVVGREVTFKAG